MEETNKILKEILKWVKFSGMSELRQILIENLKTTQDRKIYELTDGKRTVKEIANRCGVSHMTVHRMWQKWLSKGILETSQNYKGRCQKIISLEEIGFI